jgi:uncharacterized damage-inducible protein DinB
MLSNTTLRGWHLDQLRKSVPIINTVMQGSSLSDMRTYRDGGTGWTLLEVLCHLRDYEALFLERAQMTIEQTSPTLNNLNPDELAAERHYNEQDLSEVYAEWSKRRGAFLDFLGQLDDAGWERVAIHPRRGPMSVQDQLALIAWHDVNHIEQMTRILAEKQS